MKKSFIVHVSAAYEVTIEAESAEEAMEIADSMDPVEMDECTYWCADEAEEANP